MSYRPGYAVMFIAVLGILVCCLDSVDGAQTYIVDDDGGTWADYTKIQDAVNASTNGDTIEVYNGTYFEVVEINWTLTIIGNGSSNTIIDGMGIGNVVNMSASNCSLSGFNLTNANSTNFGSGVAVQADGCAIENNTYYQCWGIFLNRSEACTIRNNYMFVGGVMILGDSLGQWNSHLIDISNLINGRPIRYWTNLSTGTVPNDTSQVILSNCSGITVEGLDLNRTGYAIEIGYSNNCTISETNISMSSIGVGIFRSENITLMNNNISDNLGVGIMVNASTDINISDNRIDSNEYFGLLLDDSDGNTVHNNSFDDHDVLGVYLVNSSWNEVSNNSASNNGYYGMFILNSTNNTVIENEFRENDYWGMVCDGSYDNEIQWNNFFDNGWDPQAYEMDGSNSWDNGSVGNYWSDYTGSDDDGDGIGDTPYDLDGSTWAEDEYPLMDPWNGTLPNGSTSEPRTWIVDDDNGSWADFEEIQDAIDASSGGDEIHIYSGTYYEELTVSKTLTIIGNGSNESFVRAGTVDDGHGMVITGSNVSLSGIDIKTQTDKLAAIKVDGDYGRIFNNTVDGSVSGIHVLSMYTVIENNYVANCERKSIRTSGASYCRIENNTLFSNDQSGIHLYQSSHITVRNNTVLENNGDFSWGIHFRDSDDCVVVNNMIRDHDSYGIYADSTSDNNEIHHNNVIDNGGTGSQGYDAGSSNSWDDGSEGNWWSDYDGEDNDHDGIGDTPYDIDGSTNTDDYPLVPRTLFIVDDDVGKWADFTNINDALNNCSEDLSYTIRIFEGRYHESIDILVGLNITGNGTGTVIDGDSMNTVVTVSAMNVILANITVVDPGSAPLDSCIMFNSTSDCIVQWVWTENGSTGFLLSSSHNITIRNSTLKDHTSALRLNASSLNKVRGCTIVDSVIGVSMEANSDSNEIFRCVIVNNTFGINVTGSSSDNECRFSRIFDNHGHGITVSENDGNGFDASRNWWNETTGPYHPADNPDGEGDAVTDLVDFYPWYPFVEFPVGNEFEGDTGGETPFYGGGESFGEIVQYSWYSDLDGVLFNGSSSYFEYTFLTNGSRNVTLSVMDADGLWSLPSNATAYSNGIPVVRRIDADRFRVNFGEEINFTAEAIDDTGIFSYRWSYDSDIHLTTTSTNWTTWDGFSGGNHTVHVRVRDLNGSSSEPLSVNISINLIPDAEILEIHPAYGIHGSLVLFNGSGTDDEGLVVRYLWNSSIDGEIYNGTEDSFSSVSLSNGTHTISLCVRDDEGAWGSAIDQQTIVNGLPTAVIESIVPNPALEGQLINLVGNYIDDGPIDVFVWWSDIDGDLYNGSVVSIFVAGTSNGSHNVSLKVQDQYGEWSDPVWSYLYVNGIPKCWITSPSGGMVVHGDVADLECVTQDDTGIALYVWNSSIDGGIYNGTGASFNTSSLSNGSHVITLAVQDLNGTWSNEDSVNLTVNGRPIAWIDHVPRYLVREGEPVGLVASAIDDGTIVTYLWNSSIDGIVHRGQDGGNLTLTNLSKGDHDLTLDVMDDLGLWSETAADNITIERAIHPENDKPTATIVSIRPNRVLVGSLVNFTGNASSNFTITRYHWISSRDGMLYDSGDRSFETDTLTPGIHVITLRVWNDVYLSSEPVQSFVFVVDPAAPDTDDPGDDWPQWGRDPGNRNSHDGADLTSLELVANISLGDPGDGVPIVVGDRAYVTTGLYSNGTIWAVDLESREVEWKRNTSEGFRFSPAFVDDTIVVASSYFVWGLDMNGDIVWNTSTNYSINAHPKIYRGLVHLTTSYGILAIDPGDGNVSWSLDLSGIRGVMAFEELLYVGTYYDEVYGIDPSTGTVVWNSSTLMDPDGPLVVSSGQLLVTSGSWFGNGSLEVFNRTSGERRWNVTLDDGQMSSPVVVGNRVILATGGTVVALSLTDGSEIWSREIGGSPEMVVVGDRLLVSVPSYLNTDTWQYSSPKLKLIDPANGKDVFSYKIEWGATYGAAPSMASVWNDTVLVQFQGSLLMLGQGNETGPEPLPAVEEVIIRMTDPTGDVHDQDGRKVGGHPDIDMTDIEVLLWDNGTVSFTISVVGKIRETDPPGEMTSYMVVIFLDDSDNLEEPADGEYNLVWLIGTFQIQDQSNGDFEFITGEVNGSTITFYVPLEDIGGSTDLRINVMFTTFVGDLGSEGYIDWSVGEDDPNGESLDDMMMMAGVLTLILIVAIVLIVIVLKRKGRKKGPAGRMPARGPPPGHGMQGPVDGPIPGHGMYRPPDGRPPTGPYGRMGPREPGGPPRNVLRDVRGQEPPARGPQRIPVHQQQRRVDREEDMDMIHPMPAYTTRSRGPQSPMPRDHEDGRYAPPEPGPRDHSYDDRPLTPEEPEGEQMHVVKTFPCPECETPIEEGTRFCDECGTYLG